MEETIEQSKSNSLRQRCTPVQRVLNTVPPKARTFYMHQVPTMQPQLHRVERNGSGS